MNGDEGQRAGGGRRGRGVTLADVAKAAGVSKTTVSNAYNRPDQLSAQLRGRVLDVASELGYPGPDPIAVTFSRRRAGAIGLVFDDPLTFALTDPAEVLFVTGIGEVCERAGVGLAFIPLGPHEDLIRQTLVDGFICHCDIDGDSRVDVAISRGLPVVVVDGPARPGAGHVGVEDREGAAAAARHLLELGHRRLAVLTASLHGDGFSGRADLARQETARYHVSRERLGGYRAEIEGAGLRWADVPVVEASPYGREAAYHACAQLLDSSDRPTGLLAASDEFALGALRAAAERGIAVPEQLSIVGFDDAPPAAWSTPALTTIRQPHGEKGQAAAEQLLGLRPIEDVTYSTELVVRSSTAPPPIT
ncbi:LacI family DNA-binding transcriptional regulator [Phytoactinopolyspora halotolerans]|uniref:LacI family DNA-binding transcriptional regulator n=1 Tax=Phytoactinopolyspora halotolerans TaxID=1981512 RepID=A0A6L9SEP1_9ACTN|nr:LacI family DNA-binding transcriptional regulator [Phytoactinopolyspora halotolerans]NEE03895.1 LacI family DNA-binding transcriptional regulator [Phytoactinopolyspora halotolerans]